MKNPVVLKNKWLYQKGINYEFENIKAYVLHRDKYTCWQCKGKSKDRRLCCHHIIYRKDDGSNEPENLITMCQTCHKTLHNSPKVIQDKVRNKLHGKRKKQLNHATQMNNIQSQLLKRVNVTETFGYITKAYRQYLKLSKEHYYDAVAIANQFGKTVEFKTEVVLLKKCVAAGDYQQTKGIRSQQCLTTSKICGFRKFDKVKYKGNEYFIKGRMSTGYAILMNIDGQTLQFKPLPKFIQLGRISARGSLIMIEKPREMSD
ncbi:MAG: HNH endonuclease [Promethearchaeota archaeon]